MTLDAFYQALVAAVNAYFPRSVVTVVTTRGVTLTCKAEIDADTFIFVYFSALTGKTSYALVHNEQRMAGFDNYRFWHYHPVEAPNQHIPCAEPALEEVLATLAKAYRDLLSG